MCTLIDTHSIVLRYHLEHTIFNQVLKKMINQKSSCQYHNKNLTEENNNWCQLSSLTFIS